MRRRSTYEYYRNDNRRRYNEYKRNRKRERIFGILRVHRLLNPIKGFNVFLGLLASIFLGILALDFVIGNNISFVHIIMSIIVLYTFIKIMKK